MISGKTGDKDYKRNGETSDIGKNRGQRLQEKWRDERYREKQGTAITSEIER